MRRSYKVRSAGSSKMPLWGDNSLTRLHPQGRWPEVPILIGTANTALLPLKVPNFGSEHEKKTKMIKKWSFFEPANTTLLPLKVPNSGSNTGSDDCPQNRFGDVGVTKSGQMSIPLSYLPYRRRHTDDDDIHMTHNDFWDLYTIGPSGKKTDVVLLLILESDRMSLV